MAIAACAACHVEPARAPGLRGPVARYCAACAASRSHREFASREWSRLHQAAAPAAMRVLLAGRWGPKHEEAMEQADARMEARLAEQERLDAALPRAPRCRCAAPAPKAERPLTVCALCSREIAKGDHP